MPLRLKFLITPLVLSSLMAVSHVCAHSWGVRVTTRSGTRSISTSSSLSDHSHGLKSVLFIRAHFPDDAGAPLPTDVMENRDAAKTNSHYQAYSYGQFSLSWNVGPLVMLPHSLDYYRGLSAKTTAVVADAKAAALAQGYDYTQYDFGIVWIPQFYGVFTNYLGAAGDTFWLEPANIIAGSYGIEGFADEFFLGMERANGWKTTDGTVFGNCPGCSGPDPGGIADPFDVLGTERSQSNYNLFHKMQVGWLASANVPRVTQSGTFRVYAQDTEGAITPGRIYGMQLPGHQGRDYWVEYRQSLDFGQSGLLLNWGGLLLLDMTPGSSRGFEDAQLVLGQTFTDPEGVSITVTGTGGTTPQWVDVAIRLPTSTPTPTPTPTPDPGLPIGARVTVDVDGVFVRSDPTSNSAVRGSQNRGSIGTLVSPCVNDSAGARVFCNVNFDFGVSGWLTQEHLVLVSMPSPTPAPPTILTEENTDRAVALNATTFVRDPFSLSTTQNFSSDKRTRVMLFVINLQLLPGDDASAVVAQAEDSMFRSYPLPVEYVGKVTNFDWLTKLNVILPDGLPNAGDLRVSVSLRGVTSNKARISIR